MGRDEPGIDPVQEEFFVTEELGDLNGTLVREAIQNSLDARAGREPVDDKNLELARQAAIFKANHRLSYADAFAAALVKTRKAELMTGDPEFKQVENEIKIGWLK